MDETLQWFLSLLSPDEWRAILWLVLATFVFTHFAKIGWRLLPIKGGGNHHAIHLLSGVIGMVVAIPLWPAGSVPWWVAGPVVGGGGAIGLFKAFFPLLAIVCPRCAATFNADRRRIEGPLPPQGCHERRK